MKNNNLLEELAQQANVARESLHSSMALPCGI